MGRRQPLKMAEFATFKGLWSWPWPWIGSYCIPSCITHRPLPTHQMSLKSKKLFVVGQTYGHLRPTLLGRLGGVDLNISLRVSNKEPYQRSWTGTTPHMSKPSSVSVPVLSKQNVLIAPHRLMLRGLMQNMFCLRNRFCANTMPTVIAAGSAGGTTIVTRSSVRRIIKPTSLPRSIYIWHQLHWQCQINILRKFFFLQSSFC